MARKLTKGEKLVEKYQCPGCMLGSDTTCGRYEKSVHDDACGSHVIATHVLGVGEIALGLPKGFNRQGPGKLTLRVFPDEPPKYNHLNVPVWAMRHDKEVLVRVYVPRTNVTQVHILAGEGAKELPAEAIDVAPFWKEID